MAFNILGISGSLRSTSSNTSLLHACAKLAPADVNFNVYAGLDKLPYFSPELDGEGAVAADTVADLRQQLQAADAVIFSTPEYAFGMPGVLKNALDWIVSSADLMNKPVAVISASPLATGGEKAHASLVQTLRVMSAIIDEENMLIVPLVRTKMDAAGKITDLQLENSLKEILTRLAVRVASAGLH